MYILNGYNYLSKFRLLLFVKSYLSYPIKTRLITIIILVGSDSGIVFIFI